MANEHEAFYFNIYNQRGGASPIFKGSRYIQYGNGFGDVLRSTTRHITSVSQNATVPKLDETDFSTEDISNQEGEGKKRKKKPISLNKKVLYKAPKKKKRKHKKSSNKKPSKYPKYNF
jgi:hypothetical protein